MAVWLVRAGKHGEQEQLALDHRVVAIGWHDLPDLSGIKDREAMIEVFTKVHPEAASRQIAVAVSQIWAFVGRMNKNDLVVLPLKKRPAIALGKVTGPYHYRTDLGDSIRHTRPVRWLQLDMPHTAFATDILRSFGAAMTVCQIERNNAEERIRKVIDEG